MNCLSSWNYRSTVQSVVSCVGGLLPVVVMRRDAILLAAAWWNLQAIEVMDRKLLKGNRGETFPCFDPKCVEARKGAGTKHPHHKNVMLSAWGWQKYNVHLWTSRFVSPPSQSRCLNSLFQKVNRKYETSDLWFHIQVRTERMRLDFHWFGDLLRLSYWRSSWIGS